MKGTYKIGLAILVIAVLAVVLIAPVAYTKPDTRNKPVKECNDGIDNDGDNYIDLADSGCDNKNDNDESNCGDSVCEGGETYESCPADCAPPDSCSDTDGGLVFDVQGTVSGYYSGSPFSKTDECTSSTELREYYCQPNNNWFYDYHNCTGINQTGCSNGACY